MPLWGLYAYLYGLSLKNLFPYRQLLQDLKNALDIKGQESILDAGCGPGLLLERIIQDHQGTGTTVTGVDLSRVMLQHARRRCKRFCNVRLVAADLNNKLDFPDGSFDKVICCHTLYALQSPPRTITEFYRLLKPGGILIIANPRPGAGQRELIREHVATLRKLTPMRKRAYHVLLFVALIPVNLIVVAINRLIIDRARRKQYHFLNEEDLKSALLQAGFKTVHISSCYAGQDCLVRAEK